MSTPAGEGRNTKVCQVEVADIDPGFIPVDQPDPASVVDADVGGAGVAVDHRPLALEVRVEMWKAAGDDLRWRPIQVGVDASPSARQLDHGGASRSLRLVSESPVEPPKLVDDQLPVVRSCRSLPLEPGLHVPAKPMEGTTAGPDWFRDVEPGIEKVDQQLQFPPERRLGPLRAPDGNRPPVEFGSPYRGPVTGGHLLDD